MTRHSDSGRNESNERNFQIFKSPFASRGSFLWRRNAKYPAAAIMAALSLLYSISGAWNVKWDMSHFAFNIFLKDLFAATPPQRIIERAPYSAAARIVLAIRTSMTACWKLAATSSLCADLRGLPRGFTRICLYLRLSASWSALICGSVRSNDRQV